MMKGIFYLYDAIFTLDLKHQQLLLLTSPSGKLNGRSFSLEAGMTLYKETYVCEDDWPRSEEFFRTDNLDERLENTENGILCGMFRTKWRGHGPVWKSHIIMRIPHLDGDAYLCMIRTADVQGESVGCETNRLDQLG